MVLQHVGHEPLGTLDPLLKAAGFRIRYVNFAREPQASPSLDSYNGLIILGGPMGVYESNIHTHLLTEMKLIEQAIAKNIPVLGICLGAQLIAATLGAQVKKAGLWELGWSDIHLTTAGQMDRLFQHFKSNEKVFQIHQDTFEIPKSSEHLAWSSLCQGQAFKYGEKVYGLQFHLEVDEAMILRWLRRPENQKIIIESQGLFQQDVLEKETHQFIPRSLQLSLQMFSKFIEIFNLPERPVILGSTHGKEPQKNHIKRLLKADE